MSKLNNEIKLLVLRDYSHDELLDNENDIIDETLDYSGSTYIIDSIMEISDGAIPIYTSEIWEKASLISEYIEDALSELGIPKDVDLIQIFSQGYYYYYDKVLHSNIEEFCFNYVANSVNEFIKAHELTLDIEELESTIDEELELIDNNSTYSELEEIIQNIVEALSVKLV